MEGLAVDEKSGAPLRFARRLRRTAGRRRSFSADSSRRRCCSPAVPAKDIGGSEGPEGCSPPPGLGGTEEAPEPRARSSPGSAQGRLRLGWRCGSGCGRSSSATCLAPILGNSKTPLCLHCPEEGLVGTLDEATSFRGEKNFTVVSSREGGCRFSRIGCPFQGDAKEREIHEADALGGHLRLLLQHVKKLKACLSPAGEDIEETTAENEVSTRFPFRPVAQGVPEGEFLSGLPLYEEGVPWPNLARRTRGDALLETKLQVFENIVSVLSKEMAASRQSFVAFRGQRGLDHDMIRGLELKIADLQRCLVQKDAALAKLEERFRASRQASYDGVFLWKIADVHHKSYEAVCGRLSSFHSPAFYTSRYGYKLCLRIYLNGEGSSKGSYLSLFLVLLKGDYDALLPWPFAQKVTLTLLDQNSGEHFANTIHPDPSSPPFQRPVGEMNEPSGFPRFIPLAKLQSPKYTYIKEGTIFLQCVAHASS